MSLSFLWVMGEIGQKAYSLGAVSDEMGSFAAGSSRGLFDCVRDQDHKGVMIWDCLEAVNRISPQISSGITVME